MLLSKTVLTEDLKVPTSGVEIEDLNVFYGKKQVLDSINLSIPKKTVTAFIGPSGCGKSTLLRSINRMHETVPGARVEGLISVTDDAGATQDVYDSKVNPVVVRRRIGMVFQRPNPFPTMSIRENVLAGLRLNRIKMSHSEASDIVESSLRSVHLWDEVKDRLGENGMGLSGGQQQRLSIARAITLEPEVLLMDEPCSALDPVSTLAIEDLITEISTKYTIVIVTHNMQQAARVSQRTAFFNVSGAGQPGRLVESGPTKQIFESPRVQATADYIAGRFG